MIVFTIRKRHSRTKPYIWSLFLAANHDRPWITVMFYRGIRPSVYIQLSKYVTFDVNALKQQWKLMTSTWTMTTRKSLTMLTSPEQKLTSMLITKPTRRKERKDFYIRISVNEAPNMWKINTAEAFISRLQLLFGYLSGILYGKSILFRIFRQQI